MRNVYGIMNATKYGNYLLAVKHLEGLYAGVVYQLTGYEAGELLAESYPEFEDAGHALAWAISVADLAAK
ncbi:MAG: hypothetical protein MR654_08005 [Corynebacterium glucuronolyticum]|nr:hypothetical protein [Corynebacterium glucuronolyticum]